MKLTVFFGSRFDKDYINAVVTNGTDLIYAEPYIHGSDYSYRRVDSTVEAPYITDVIQNLIDHYDIDEFHVRPTEDAFCGKPITPTDVESFVDRYCDDLQLAGNETKTGNLSEDTTEQGFTDAVASIPVPEDGLKQ